jgi:hypothetical protein
LQDNLRHHPKVKVNVPPHDQRITPDTTFEYKVTIHPSYHPISSHQSSTMPTMSTLTRLWCVAQSQHPSVRNKVDLEVYLQKKDYKIGGILEEGLNDAYIGIADDIKVNTLRSSFCSVTTLSHDRNW